MTKQGKSIADQLEARGWMKGREEGRLEGLEEARQEGLREARTTFADVLRYHLEHKFGEVPDRLEARIAAANVQLLARWLDRAVEATSLDDVFAD